MVQTWNFNKYVLETEYPESGTQIQFGRGYQFATKPKGPDQVIYTLNFRAMWFYFLPNGQLDLSKNPTINMGVMEAFYQAHRLYEPFIFPHDTKGNLTVRFKEPLKFKLVENGKGQIEPFSVKFIQQP